MKKIVNYILVLTIGFGHWSFASADLRHGSLPEEVQQRLDSVLGDSIPTDKAREQLYETVIIKGPAQDNTSMVSRSLSAEEGLLMFQAYEAERKAAGISNENFFEQITGNDKIRSMSPVVNLEEHPNFFRNAEARFEELKEELELKRAQQAIQLKAERSLESKSEKSKNLVNLFIRSGTTVFFFAVLANPSTLGLATIGVVSLGATYFYLQMATVEKMYKAGGNLAKAIDRTAGKAVYKMADYINIKQQTKDWAAEFYREKIRSKGYAEIVGQLGVSFGVVMVLTILYTATMNLHAIGFSESVAASGKFFAWDRSFDYVPFRFFDGISLGEFLGAFKSEFVSFQIEKAWSFIWSEPIVIKSLLLTAFAETWTVFRMKYRGMTSDQKKANNLGRLAGIFFALMGPFVHKSTAVINGTSSQPLDMAGLFLVGLVGATGLAYVLGDARAYNERIAKIGRNAKLRTKNMIDSVKAATAKVKQAAAKASPSALRAAAIRAYENSKRNMRSTAAASMMGMMELTHAWEVVYANTSKAPSYSDTPALFVNNYFTNDKSISCKYTF